MLLSENKPMRTILNFTFSTLHIHIKQVDWLTLSVLKCKHTHNIKTDIYLLFLLDSVVKADN